eukprot:Hpha_TRINITY_DN16017_c0_g4::TRINITY_DN16017_c0_g4_i2::g.118109::m.118109/K02685/PRI2; DNA primase large subunit
MVRAFGSSAPSRNAAAPVEGLRRLPCMDPRRIAKEAAKGAKAGGGWMHLYSMPPQGEVTLERFEEATVRRMTMLCKIIEMKAKGESFRSIVTQVAAGAKHEQMNSHFLWFDGGELERQQLLAERTLRQDMEIPLEDLALDAQGRRDKLLAEQTFRLKKFYDEVKKEQKRLEDEMWEQAFLDDAISHFACRLALCTDERQQKWFTEAEEFLFRGRVEALLPEDRMALLSMVNTSAELYTPSEEGGENAAFRFLLDPLKRDKERTRETACFRVRFTAVPRLVRDRSVVVRGGYALLSPQQVLEVMFGKYRSLLEKGLQRALEARPAAEADEGDRIMWFLSSVVQNMMEGVEQREVTPGAVVAVEDIALHAERHMPLCMRQLDRHARKFHHLKWDGRFQYGIFLKRIGLSLEDSIRFFGETLTLRGGGTPEKFNKGPYGYNVRHWYGKEGKKTSYNALNCTTIIRNPGPKGQQCHGCPFHHSTDRELKQLLMLPQAHPIGGDTTSPFSRSIQLSDREADAIVKKAGDGHPTAACHMYFRKAHAPYPENSSLFASPYEYWNSSVTWVREKEEAQRQAEEGVVTPARPRKFPKTPSSAGSTVQESPVLTTSVQSPILPSP